MINQSLHQQIHDYERLTQVLQVICSSLEVDEILQRIISAAVNLCGVPQGSIILFHENEDRSARTLVRAGAPASALLDHFLNNQLAGWVSKHRSVLLSHDIYKVFGHAFDAKKYQRISSLLSVPLSLRGEICGVINLISVGDEKPLSQREARLMTILAAQCVHFIANAKLHQKLFDESQRLRKAVQDKYAFHGIIGNSPAMRKVYRLLERVIPTDGRVLIEGESGTGKELVTKVLHYNGPRKDGPFVAVDCGALPASLLESELFGYVKGAFTGAGSGKKGLFEEAHNGTLFLDEIANMPLEIQSKLLRAIQESEVRPLGGNTVRKINVRIIAAAGNCLHDLVRNGTFREDLFYRLNVVNVKLPPLRQRTEDITLLAHHFLQKFSSQYEKPLSRFEPETLALLESYAWPGNVRELENAVERMVILASAEQKCVPSEFLPSDITLGREDVPTATPDTGNSHSIKEQKALFEKSILLDALQKHHWNQSAAAQDLGVHESTVRYYMKKFRLNRPA